MTEQAESNLSAESFDHLRHMICTNIKKTIVDLPAAIQKHLLQAYYFTNISLKIIDTTKSTQQLLNFYLREMPKKFIKSVHAKQVVGIAMLVKNTNIYAQDIENIRIVKIYNFFSFIYVKH